MGNIFRLDSPLMKLLTLVTNLICLNFLWLLCCLPIVTAGASTTAMYYCIYRYITKQDDAVVKPFFQAFRDNIPVVTPIWFLNLLIDAVFVAELFYLTQSNELWLKIVFGVLLFMYLGVSNYLYPILSRYEVPVKTALKNSIALSLRHIFSTVLVVGLNLIPVVLAVFSPSVFWKSAMLWLVGGFSLIAYLCGRILFVVFHKYDEPEE